ncbi:helix-turn-helix domain-containing protein [Paenibacillus lautus]|uniref:helix-turn-helix domain-containing protein n=1 Tax=Paenibacillus lautus TaxID=1401 RepID=UPI0039880569
MTGLEEAIRSVVVEVIAEEIAAVEQRILAQLPMQFDQTLDVHEAASHIGISEKLVYRLCQEGSLPHERFGVSGSRKPTIKIRLSDLENWRAEQKVSKSKRLSNGK